MPKAKRNQIPLREKQTCVKARQAEDAIRRQAARHGLTLRVSQVTSGNGGGTLHWMFDDAKGQRVADYWPGNGTFRTAGQSRKVASPAEALALVAGSEPETPPGDSERSLAGQATPEPCVSAEPVSHADVRRAFEDAVGLPRSTPRSVHGVYLNAFEAGYFDRAVRAGRLVCEPCFPCASPIPEAWRRHCKAVGIECVIIGE